MKLKFLLIIAILLGIVAGCEDEYSAGHSVNRGGILHGDGLYAPLANCAGECHGGNLTGWEAPSCYNCHGQFWNNAGVAQSTHTYNPMASGTMHHKALATSTNKAATVQDYCTGCHGPTLQGGTANANAGCYSCHGQRW